MQNIFQKEVTNEVVARINALAPTTQPQWGKMNVSQMLAHCKVAYEMVYENHHKKPNAFMKIIMRLFVKNVVVGPKPYKRNSPTAPAFIITEQKDFNKEKARLIAYVQKTQALGENAFDQKESNAFGKLTKEEWNVMFYKHIDHHLTQFGV